MDEASDGEDKEALFETAADGTNEALFTRSFVRDNDEADDVAFRRSSTKESMEPKDLERDRNR